MELEDQRVRLIQSPPVSRTLQSDEPYAYWADVLQRVGQHPQKRTVELTPSVLKTTFADRPLRSDLNRNRKPPTQLKYAATIRPVA